MKVKDLIQHLQHYDPDDDVYVLKEYDQMFGATYKPIEDLYYESSGYDAEADKVLYTIYLE